MSSNQLSDRGRQLDDAFFKQDAQGFRDALAADEAEAAGALARATGIDDEPLLARLAELGIRPETLAALTLIPLIETAWADGVMDSRERSAILDGAASCGIGSESASHRLLELWTQERPTPDLVLLWREFLKAVAETLNPQERANLRAKVIGRAHAVAAAAGGLLDASPNVSPEEWAVMDDLGAAFGVED
ncbi:MAG: hypothetical protein AAF430_20485 [Myxococcota bacterium]